MSSGITISPDPLGSIVISPSVLVDEKVFPSKVKLSTFHWSTLRFWSRIATKPFDAVDAFADAAIVPGA